MEQEKSPTKGRVHRKAEAYFAHEHGMVVFSYFTISDSVTSLPYITRNNQGFAFLTGVLKTKTNYLSLHYSLSFLL